MFEKINSTYYADYPDLQIRFEPNITWDKKNKKVQRIGIRATNSYCNAKKIKDNNPNFHGYYKQDVLDRFSFVFEKDVKSSVPRLTASINSGKWIPEKEDIYERIYKSYLKLKYPEEMPKGAVIFADARPAIKYLHMRCYFDKEGRVGLNTRNVMGPVKDKKAVDSEMKLLRQAVVDAEGGKLYDNEIFYYESIIYGRVLKQLLDEGFFVWICYDAFYSTAKEGWDQERFEKYVQSLVEFHANKFIDDMKSVDKLNKFKDEENAYEQK